MAVRTFFSLGLCLSSAAAFAGYSVDFINPLEGDTALEVVDVSDDGNWFVGRSYGPGGARAVRWQLGGQPQFLDYAYVHGINNDGTVAGETSFPSPMELHHRATIWLADGTKVYYPYGVAGTSQGSHAWAINNNGMVAGDMMTPYFAGTAAFLPTFYSNSTSYTSLQLLPGGSWQSLDKLNDNNWAIGYTSGGSFTKAYVSRAGAPLEWLSLYDPQGYSQAYDINNHNNILGLASGAGNAVVWREDGSLNVLGGHQGLGTSINNRNQVVGYGIFNGKEKALVWNDFSGNAFLQEKLPGIYHLDWQLSRAHFISDNGNIVATLIDQNNNYFTVLLTPDAVPEPGLTLIIGSAFVALRRRPRKDIA